MGTYVLCFSNRGYERHITTDFELLSEYYIRCGACAQICPTGAIMMEDKGDIMRERYTHGAR
ncbi:MAG: 4Fe-4S binding protein [Deltaproteobacteria bacterium]|nr:4Fe-4S binding protein [Deltaproteobacteria bacterium]